MRCSECGSKSLLCVDSRETGSGRKRRYKCRCCGSRFNTIEHKIGEATAPTEVRKVKEEKKNTETKCWSCGNYASGCSWSRDWTPVDGWTAEKTTIKQGDEYNESYNVIDCPEYIWDRRTKRKQAGRNMPV